MTFRAQMYDSAGSITVVIERDGKSRPYNVDKTHHSWDKLKEAYKANDSDMFLKYLDVEEVKKEFVKIDSQGQPTGLELIDDTFFFNGKQLHNVICQIILDLREEGSNIDPMVKFLENLMENPSSRAINELYPFLQHRQMPVTEDGCFVAYKAVQGNFYSKASGTLTLIQGESDSSGHINNAVGQVVECPRNEVDDDRAHECSHGLHVGSLAYSGPNGWYRNGGDRVVLVKVNPRDVVSVPRDHKNTKLRVCKYEVIGEFEMPLDQAQYERVPQDEIFENYEEYEEDWEDDDYDDEYYDEDDDENYWL